MFVHGGGISLQQGEKTKPGNTVLPHKQTEYPPIDGGWGEGGSRLCHIF